MLGIFLIKKKITYDYVNNLGSRKKRRDIKYEKKKWHALHMRNERDNTVNESF